MNSCRAERSSFQHYTLKNQSISQSGLGDTGTSVWRSHLLIPAGLVSSAESSSEVTKGRFRRSLNSLLFYITCIIGSRRRGDRGFFVDEMDGAGARVCADVEFQAFSKGNKIHCNRRPEAPLVQS